MALIGRAALWAAGKETDAEVSAINGDQPATLSRDAADSAVEISVTGRADRAVPVTVTAALRRVAAGA